jgi:hypothetical protein
VTGRIEHQGRQCRAPFVLNQRPALGLLFILSALMVGCGQRPAAAPSTEVRICVEPHWWSSAITPHVRTRGPWIDAEASEVVHLRGRPDERRGNLWFYRESPAPGALEVFRFAGPRVVSVSVLPGADSQPLCGTESDAPEGSGESARLRMPLTAANP